jgi:hypothetical protein
VLLFTNTTGLRDELLHAGLRSKLLLSCMLPCTPLRALQCILVCQQANSWAWRYACTVLLHTVAPLPACMLVHLLTDAPGNTHASAAAVGALHLHRGAAGPAAAHTNSRSAHTPQPRSPHVTCAAAAAAADALHLHGGAAGAD